MTTDISTAIESLTLPLPASLRNSLLIRYDLDYRRTNDALSHKPLFFEAEIVSLATDGRVPEEDHCLAMTFLYDGRTPSDSKIVSVGYFTGSQIASGFATRTRSWALRSDRHKVEWTRAKPFVGAVRIGLANGPVTVATDDPLEKRLALFHTVVAVAINRQNNQGRVGARTEEQRLYEQAADRLESQFNAFCRHATGEFMERWLL